jgi:hypothetical protein
VLSFCFSGIVELITNECFAYGSISELTVSFNVRVVKVPAAGANATGAGGRSRYTSAHIPAAPNWQVTIDAEFADQSACDFFCTKLNHLTAEVCGHDAVLTAKALSKESVARAQERWESAFFPSTLFTGDEKEGKHIFVCYEDLLLTQFVIFR